MIILSPFSRSYLMKLELIVYIFIYILMVMFCLICQSVCLFLFLNSDVVVTVYALYTHYYNGHHIIFSL